MYIQKETGFEICRRCQKPWCKLYGGKIRDIFIFYFGTSFSIYSEMKILCCLVIRRNLLCSCLCQWPLVLALGTTEKSLALSSLYPPFRNLYIILMISPIGFLQCVFSSGGCWGGCCEQSPVTAPCQIRANSSCPVWHSAWPHQCRGEGRDHLPLPAGNTTSNVDQDTIRFQRQ